MASPPRELAAFLLAHIRDHYSGPERKGAAVLREHEDRYELIFDPCGSGGAMRRRLGSAQTRLPAATPATFQRKNEVPPYCTHCAANARTAIARFGWPIYVTRFDPDPAKPCGWTIYKTPDAVPDRYFEEVGQTKAPRMFRRSYWMGEGNPPPVGRPKPFEVAAIQSRDPGSNRKGGDLGWLTKNQVPTEIAEAFSRLELGRYTRSPVKTQYGWHVIRLLERYGEDSFLANQALNEFLGRSKRDTYETTNDWQMRVSSLSLTHRITLELEQYEADQGRFHARFGGVPMSLPLPPEVARSLANAKTVDLEGELKVLDANFFELANAKVLLPDGKTHTIVAKVCPKTLAEVMPGLRAFQSPRLATLRRQILESSIPETLEKARKAGFDRQAAIAATNEQLDRYTNDAERIRATKDAAVAAELRNLDKLPLGYTCQGPKGESVCRYIEHMWRAMAAYAMAEAMSCR